MGTNDGSLLALGTVAVLTLAGAAARAPALYGSRNTMRLFHGTKGDFTAFDLDHPDRKDFGWLGRGVYLTDSEDLAKVYARVKKGAATPRMLHIEVDGGRFYDATLEDKRRIAAAGPQASRAFAQRLKAQGYIGARLDHAPNGVEYVVFDPSRVRVVGSEPVQPYGRRGSMAMLEPRELPRDARIEVRVNRVGRSRFCVEIFARAGSGKDAPVIGTLVMVSNDAHPDILEVSESKANLEGLGPLLYDIGLELANRLGMRGVAPDQEEISEDAAKVWAYYYSRRREGMVSEQKVVNAKRLPREVASLVEGGWGRDDIYEDVRFRHALNSVYTKPRVSILPQLESMGVLETVDTGKKRAGSKAMLEPRELPRDTRIEVRVTRVGRRVYVEVYALGGRGEDAPVLGMFRMESNAAHPDILEVSETEARLDGLGPLLYDIGLEMANRLGMRGVAPDQSDITEDAANVWVYYHSRRGAGRVAEQKVVTTQRLPRDFREEDEDEDRDDIYDESRFRSALGSFYSKPRVAILPQLERMGVLEMVEGGMNLRGSANARNAFGPRKPLGVHGLTYRVKQNSSGDTLIAVYEGSKRIAHLDAYWEYSMRSIEEKEEKVRGLPSESWTRLKRGAACATDLRNLGAEGKYPNVIGVHHAYITEDKWKGKGVGRAMYEALLSEAFTVRKSRVGGTPGPMFAVPDSCLGVGSTSPDAMRVWDSLARRYPSSGTVIRVDAPPVLGTPNRSR